MVNIKKYVTKSEFNKLLKNTNDLRRKNVAVVGKLKEAVNQHRHYMKRRGRKMMVMQLYLQKVKEMTENIQTLKGLLEVVKLPQKIETIRGRKYILRLSRNEYLRLMQWIRRDFRGRKTVDG